MPSGGAGVCQRCRKQVPHTGRLKQQFYCLLVLEAQSLRSRCEQALFLLRAVRERVFQACLPASGDLLAILSVPRLVETSPRSLSSVRSLWRCREQRQAAPSGCLPRAWSHAPAVCSGRSPVGCVCQGGSGAWRGSREGVELARAKFSECMRIEGFGGTWK